MFHAFSFGSRPSACPIYLLRSRVCSFLVLAFDIGFLLGSVYLPPMCIFVATNSNIEVHPFFEQLLSFARSRAWAVRFPAWAGTRLCSLRYDRRLEYGQKVWNGLRSNGEGDSWQSTPYVYHSSRK